MKKEKFFFDDIFEDWTKLGKKILKSKYLVDGKYPVIDQGKNKIAGFINEEKKLFLEIPVIIFGDHTRILKFIDFPFFLGADGVKILKNKRKNFLDKYLYYALKYFKIPDTGYNRHFKWLKDFFVIDLEIEKQEKVIGVLDEIQKILKSKKEQLSEFEKLSKCLFFEMVKNSRKVLLAEVAEINMGQSPDSLFYNSEKKGIPFFQGKTEFGENYIKEIKYYCSSPIKIAEENSILMSVRAPVGTVNITDVKCCIGRGLASIKNKNIDMLYLFYALKNIEKEIEKKGVGSTFKAITKKVIEKIEIPVVSLEEQNKFAERIKLIEKSKFILSEILKLQSECIFLKQI